MSKSDLWKKELILADDSRGEVHNGGEGTAAGDWSAKLGDGIFIHMQEAESELKMGSGYKFPKPTVSDMFHLLKSA